MKLQTVCQNHCRENGKKERITYNAIRQHSPPRPSQPTRITAAQIRIHRASFPFHRIFLNFKENMGSGLTISQHSMRRTGITTQGIVSKEIPDVIMAVYPIQKIAFAGIGSPMKDVVCRVSMLNFASLRTPATGMIRANQGRIPSR